MDSMEMQMQVAARINALCELTHRKRVSIQRVSVRSIYCTEAVRLCRTAQLLYKVPYALLQARDREQDI